MELRVAATVDQARWDEALIAAGGTIFHSSAWAAHTLAEQAGATPRWFTLVGDDGADACYALGFAARSRRPVVSAFTGRLWLDSMPVVAGGDARLLAAFLRLLESHARDEGYVELEVGSFATPVSPYTLEDLGFDVKRRLEFELDLTQPEDVIWERLEYKRRKNVRKAERLGVTLRDLHGAEGTRTLRAMQAESSERIVARGGPDVTYRAQQARDPLETMLETGHARIVGAFVDGECVSAGYFSFFNGLVYYTASGHGRRALETQAPTYMLWETIKRFKAEGATRFNFGGCGVGAIEEDSPEHGVYVYKKAMGGAVLECASASRVLRQQVHGLTGLLRRALHR